jgi:hypothetical protein
VDQLVDDQTFGTVAENRENGGSRDSDGEPPVGSTKHDVEDWLKAHDFTFGRRPDPIRQEVPLQQALEHFLTERGVSLKDATECHVAQKRVVDGNPGDKVQVYLLFGSDGKLLRLYAYGSFIFL